MIDQLGAVIFYELSYFGFFTKAKYFNSEIFLRPYMTKSRQFVNFNDKRECFIQSCCINIGINIIFNLPLPFLETTSTYTRMCIWNTSCHVYIISFPSCSTDAGQFTTLEHKSLSA